MTPKKKDNPAAFGVMGVVLIGALFSVGRSLFSSDAPHAVRAIAATADTPSEGVRAGTGTLPASERDPFSSPLLQRAALLQSGTGPSLGRQPAGLPPDASVRRPNLSAGTPVLAPLTAYMRIQPNPPPPSHTPTPVQASSDRTARTGGYQVTPKLGGASPTEEMALARSIRVTAIVMGAHPYAVLEPVGSKPRTLHSAESYHTLRLMAIRAGEIVLKGQSGLWTLPLATPENETFSDEGKN